MFAEEGIQVSWPSFIFFLKGERTMENSNWIIEPIIFKHTYNPVSIFSDLIDLKDKEIAVRARLDEVKIKHPKWLYYIISLMGGTDSSFVIGQPLGMMTLSELRRISNNMEKYIVIHIKVSPVIDGSIKFTIKEDKKNPSTTWSDFTLIPDCSTEPKRPKGEEKPSNEEITKEDIEAVASSHKFNFWEAFILGSLLGSAIKNDMEKNEKEEKKKEDSSDESL